MAFERFPNEILERICNMHLNVQFQQPLTRHLFSENYHDSWLTNKSPPNYKQDIKAVYGKLGCTVECSNHNTICSRVLQDTEHLIQGIMLITRISARLRAVAYRCVDQFAKQGYESYLQNHERYELYIRQWHGALTEGYLLSQAPGSHANGVECYTRKTRYLGRAQCDTEHLVTDYGFILAQLRNVATMIWGKKMTDDWGRAKPALKTIPGVQRDEEDDLIQ